MATRTTVVDDELHAIAAAEQRRELMAAREIESDLDLAFHLQLQEALAASISLQPSSSTSPPPPPLPTNEKSSFIGKIEKLETVLDDLAITHAEARRLQDDFHRRIHDAKLAREIQRMPEEEWLVYGDDFERPFGEGSSKGVIDDDEVFGVYFKGLIGEERVGCGSVRTVTLAAVGVAICDSSGELIFELKKPVDVIERASRGNMEWKALIEALNAAIALDLKRIVFYCDYFTLYQFVTGRWSPKQKKIATLVNQVNLLRQKFTYCIPSLIPRNEVKFAFKLAREAIVSQMNKVAVPTTTLETCVICLEDTDTVDFFSVDDCNHRYCFSCMKQHIEVKLLRGISPKCPHEGCNLELKIGSCEKFLTPKLTELMRQRVKEDSIPVMEKVYCPYPKCSALMSKVEVLEKSKVVVIGTERSGARICIKCNGPFCINCKVPLHRNMTCADYKRRNPAPLMEDAKLKSLAARNLWRQCVKCNHMIELATGCYHMTCRCGYEFCYTCGAEWKEKKATCECPLWDNEHIMDDDYDEEEDAWYEDDEDDDSYDSQDFDDY